MRFSHRLAVVERGCQWRVAAGLAGVLLWAWRSPFPTDDFSATLRNGLSRLGFLFWAVLLLAAASMTALQDLQATAWRDVAIGEIPEIVVYRNPKGTFTRPVTAAVIAAIVIPEEPRQTAKRAVGLAVVALSPAVDADVCHSKRTRAAMLHCAVFPTRIRTLHPG